MVSRRRFLTRTGATCIAAAAGGLGPYGSPVWAGERSAPVAPGYAGEGLPFLQLRQELLGVDPKVFLGYPTNKNVPPEGYFEWRDELFKAEIGSRALNNAGDPYLHRSTYNSHYLEAETIDRFAARFGFDPYDTWGFISHSGTDSNMHGVYIGRTLLRQRTGVAPKIYYNKETHYSIEIIRDLLAIEGVLVDATEDGSMDIADFERKLSENREAPALVVPTIGTTFKGAIDDIDKIQEVLRGHESYVHLDAALFGGYLQASEFADSLALFGSDAKRYDSLAVSCHKFFSFPMVAGLFVTERSTFEEFHAHFSKVHNPVYISHVPGTITTSRNAVSPALFHYFSTESAFEIQRADAEAVLSDAGYLYGQMKDRFPELAPRRASERSNIVYFNAVDEQVKRKWTLATVDSGDGKPLAHAVVMPHASRVYLDQFLADLEAFG